MARDFVKLEAPARTRKKKEGGSIILVLSIVVIAGLCFAAGFWLGGSQSSQPAAVGASQSDLDKVGAELEAKRAEAEVLQARIETLQDQVEQWKAKAGAGAHPKVGELQFYKELPKQSVTPSSVPDSKPATARAMDQSLEVEHPQHIPTAPAAERAMSDAAMTDGAMADGAADQVTYRVQLASFRTRDDATSLQLKLMKAGFTAFVHSVNLADRGQWFRVYAGPYANKDLAKDAVRNIQDKMNIRGMLVREG